MGIKPTLFSECIICEFFESQSESFWHSWGLHVKVPARESCFLQKEQGIPVSLSITNLENTYVKLALSFMKQKSRVVYN